MYQINNESLLYIIIIHLTFWIVMMNLYKYWKTIKLFKLFKFLTK